MVSKRTLGVWVLGAFCLVAGAGAAAAQSGGAAAQSGGAAAQSGGADAAAGVARQVALSPGEQVSQADAMVSRMEASRGNVRRQLESARTQRDVVKVLCLNDKLNQIDVAVRSAKERKQALEAAAQRNDADLASHEFTILGFLRQRAEQLSTEANQCINDEGFTVDDTTTVRVIESPDEDVSEYPTTDVVIDLPSCASCFK